MATLSEMRDDDLAWGVVLRERTRLADALHDGALQEVVTLRHDCTDAIEGDLGALVGLQDGLRRMTAELRALTGAMHEPSLGEVTLGEALDRVVGAVRIRGQLAIALDVAPDADGYNDPVVRESVRELTSNVVQHARATTVAVSVALVGDELQLVVADDGVGLDAGKARAARTAGHIGLGRLERLAERLGGSVEIGPGALAGTCVVVRFPVAALKHRHDVHASAPQGRATPGRTPQAAHEIMRAADRRDVVATAEDVVAAARDRAATLRDGAGGRPAAHRPGDRGRLRSVGISASVRRPSERAALQDREHAAADRERGASQRALAAADRSAFAAQLLHAETDALTGVRTRSAGLRDLDREIERSHRGDGALVVAYVDVVGLKAVNDRDGHAAGDLLLRRVVETVRERLRPYDVVVRLGGDEFVCVLPGLPLVMAQHRFAGIAVSLAQPPGAAIRTGYAQLRPSDTSATLIARADEALLRLPRGPQQRSA